MRSGGSADSDSFAYKVVPAGVADGAFFVVVALRYAQGVGEGQDVYGIRRLVTEIPVAGS